MDIKINRYHLINPDKGELLIQQTKSNGYSWIWVLIIFGGMSAFFVF